MLIPISPYTTEFEIALLTAWQWTQRRPRIYCNSGARMTLDQYLSEAKPANVRHLALIEHDELIAVVRIRASAGQVFDVHVTARPSGCGGLLQEALGMVRDILFKMGAVRIHTNVGTYRGHVHKGIQRIVEACGMTPTGCVEQDENTVWREYAITREAYGKSI